MSTSEFDNYKADYLFLLIGENPLPNYVAAKLMLNKGGTVLLVHTTDTLTQAKQLQKILESELNGFIVIKLCPINDYESDAYYIQKEISEKLGSIKGGKIGLNYTGGTKAMSAHSYRALFYEKIKDKTYRQREGIIFSYLDPRRLEMCIDKEDNERKRLKVKPDTLLLKLKTLFELHGLNFDTNDNSPTQEAQLPELAKELAKVFADNAKAKQWFDWYMIFLNEVRKKKKDNTWGDWKSETDLQKLLIYLNDLSNVLPKIVTAFQTEGLLKEDKQLLWKKVLEIEGVTKIKHFCEWLNGKWLEHYVLQEIKDIYDKDKGLIQDYGLNFEIPLDGTKEGFEFDVAFTRGYQLFAISCTTDSKRDLCKSKLFEAYLRARQMGGDEARVALVCCFDEPDSLKAEISRTIPNNKIAVFGRQDLANLSEEITKWIARNDREAL